MIERFDGKFRFLSNFHPCLVTDALGDAYKSVEHAYQAAKSFDRTYRFSLQTAEVSPGRAKRLGRSANLRPDWGSVKQRIMYRLVLTKFVCNPNLEAQLLSTGDEYLVEGNTWGDTYWGICKGRGQNELGKILMRVRTELRAVTWYAGVVKVISGGQIGADLAGLEAASALGIATGGTAPKGWRQKDGSFPKLREYGLVEHRSRDYPPRTQQNVVESDATIRFATDFKSTGEQCTLKYIHKHNKPHFDFRLLHRRTWPRQLEYAVDWLVQHQIQILNVAGNADRVIAPSVRSRLSTILQGSRLWRK